MDGPLMIGKSKLLLVTTAAVGALAIAAAIWAPAAGAKQLAVNGPLVNLGVGVDQDGVSVDAGVGDVDVDVEAGVGDDGVNAGVGVGVGDTEASVDVGVGGGSGSEQGGGSGGGGGSNESTGNEGGGSGGGGSGGGNDGQTSSGDDRAPGVGGRPASGTATSGSGDGAAGAAGGDGTPGAAGSGDGTAGNGDGATADANERRSVVERIIAYVPDWVWIALAAMFLFCLAVVGYSWRERRRRHAAERNATVDPLTGAANRKVFDARFEEELSRARRHERPLGVMMLDLDRFKQVNDEHGHAAGDDVLIELASQLGSHLRSSDLVARVGGDEFAVILPETGMRGLVGLRETLEARLPETIGHDVGVSVGIAELRTSDTKPSDVLSRADRSMYRRKRRHHDKSEPDLAPAETEPQVVSA